MDSRIGLDYIVENKEYTAKLGSGAHIFPHLTAIRPSTSGRSMDWERKNVSRRIFFEIWNLSLKSDFSSLSEWTLPMPETKIWDHFSIQIYPLLVGNMASETTFGHWKVVFSWGKGRKMTFSQNPLSSRFWASGFWMSILSSANFKKDPPWKIFFLSVHAPATSVHSSHYSDTLVGHWKSFVVDRVVKEVTITIS